MADFGPIPRNMPKLNGKGQLAKLILNVVNPLSIHRAEVNSLRELAEDLGELAAGAEA